ncbi:MULTISPECIES: ABC transporter substrate-binding protein [Kitasatospora]|uniref:Putative acetamidase regulator n=1 Tax=Kitasatospora setae (strain ATCC 33774 / DSM 43861 / JCM 3304 / KCC A-0304 / NBRC 14216 / KM-6054) TaxID=452652 RepID=E4N5H0_KITSK|nr:ABC transporter substrate-binding protein [Kitasatospora setae]BAJ26451.1 putative acetamidase regulator [Kitasatospora setae KM-6054]
MTLDARLVDPLDALHLGREGGAFRVGLVVPQSGTLGLTGPSALDGALLAAHEVNARGGVLGRPLELVLVDGGGAPQPVAAEVRRLLAAGALDALAGCHTSDVHRAVEEVAAERIAYVFTPPHEGGSRRPGVLCTGIAPAAQLGPAIARLTELHGLRRWALVGNDYIWPRSVHRAAARLAAGAGARVVLERRLPFGTVERSVEPLLDELRATRADALLLSLIGRDQVLFNRALRRSGLDRRLVRLSGSLEENGLLALGGDGTGTLYAAMPSFATLAEEPRQLLAERHRALCGPWAPVLDAYAVGLYDGLHLLATLAARRALEPAGLARAAAPLLRAGRRTVHLARAEGPGFAVLP